MCPKTVVDAVNFEILKKYRSVLFAFADGAEPPCQNIPGVTPSTVPIVTVRAVPPCITCTTTAVA